MSGWWSASDDEAVVARLLNDELTARFLRQSESLNRIDIKGTALLGFTLTLATFTATTSVPTPWLVLVLSCLVVSAVAGIQATRVRKYGDAPEPHQIGILVTWTEQAALRVLMKVKQEAFDKNAKVLKAKARWWRWSLGGLVAGVAFLALALLLDVRGMT